MCAGRSNVALCRTAGNAAEAYGREALRSGASKRFAFGFNADSRRSRRSGLRRGWPPLCRQSVGKALNNRFPISVLRRTWIALCVEELVDAESSEMNVAIVTISDSSFQDASLDRSGPLMRELLEKSEKLGVTVSNVLIIPDEKELISKTLVDLCNLAVVLTSGELDSPLETSLLRLLTRSLNEPVRESSLLCSTRVFRRHLSQL
ncbi:hypothetical protein L596_010986 [Steinernema carpocapsae]|uniref:MoaB/Mog domain-containing protein n=1 Tax=Steinernema carpocapsae TaxID=34508 RepID=A0A4U5NTA9_STECR|nr:hypothetical protein L596_010986 [Steinernema carpocapsae]